MGVTGGEAGVLGAEAGGGCAEGVAWGGVTWGSCALAICAQATVSDAANKILGDLLPECARQAGILRCISYMARKLRIICLPPSVSTLSG